MAQVVYKGEYPGVVTGDGVSFENGKPVEVDAETAKTLVSRSDFVAYKAPKGE